ncbi:fungal-specific transcription factor domain-containing protein [Flammula alnicola]|nr:fungal-specific transcription factor domain-containing protein [Flammula alnicola]
MQNSDSTSTFMKGPKRKRLAKACDACHKSKRRCDGTAPCSNCYYASKQCTYTDASGRPVPAPRPFKPERQDPQPSSSTSENRSYPSSQFSAPSANQFRIYSNPPTPPQQFQGDNSDDDHKHTRKRFRNERGNPLPVDELIIDGPISGVSMDRPTAIELDPCLTRELTNLFFTHCHPARIVIHKPTFSSSLSHNRVPSHLLLAVCALAAPLSKQPHLRTTPARFAGRPFAQEALSQMFDGAGRLVVEPDLAAAQALCILQMHDILTKDANCWSSRFHDLALQVVEGLGVHSPEHPTLTPVPSQEFVQQSIEREAIRRIFWLIHLLDVMSSIYFKKPTTFSDSELRLRLPVDETSFELGVHSTLPEYLYLPAVRTQYTSEFGHLIRIISIYAKMECALDDVNDSERIALSTGALMEAEQRMDEWESTLPEHLRFSEQCLQVQQSMFETSSNAGAWCWCCIHVWHASCALGLNLARQRMQRGPKTERTWAVERIELILQMLGDRAKNSFVMGAALWSLVKYCKRDDPQTHKWASDYEEAFGTDIFELVRDFGSQPSPPQQHQYPTHSHSQVQQSQQLQQQQPHNMPHGNPYHTQHQHQLPHRRLSDIRNPGPQDAFNLNLNNSNNSRPPHQHAPDVAPYGNSNNGNAIMKRSPSHSPPMSYSIGRPPNTTASSNSSNASNRSLGMNQHLTTGLPDNSLSSNANHGGRDARAGQTCMNAAAGSSAIGGSAMGHGGNGSEASLSQNQQQNVPGKYSGREVNHQVNTHSRWPQMTGGGDSVGGTGGEGGMQAGYLGPGVSSNGKITGNGNASVTGGAASGVGGSGTTGQRNFGSLGDTNQSLPSLKASGLLDSWGSASRNAGSVDVQKQTSNSASQQQPQLASPRRMTSPSIMNLTLLATSQHPGVPHPDAAGLRPPTTLAMPVGLQWLANESR